MNRLFPRTRLSGSVLLFSLLFMACDDSATLLDAEKLRKKLDLTPVQSDIVSSHVRLAVEEVKRYLEVVRLREQELNRRDDIRVSDQMLLQDPEVESTRLEAVSRIKQIASNIREELTPDQKAKFDRITLPNLMESPRELAFMILDVSGGRFASMETKTSTKIKEMTFSAGTSDTTRYNVLRDQRTIILGEPAGKDYARIDRGAPPSLKRFPVSVMATLVDSVFIVSEHRYTAPADSIDGINGQVRLQSLLARQRFHDILTIRLALSTTLHESYIDMDRWAVFIEDQDGRPYEPVEIVAVDERPAERPAPPVAMTAGRQRGTPGGGRGRPGGDRLFDRKARRYELRFQAADVYGNYLINPGTKFLQLVFFDKNDPQFRTQGKWALK